MPTDIPTEGIFAVYKERGMTSHDVVDAVRRVTGQERVGHAGTLDPLAQGVLIVGVGRPATRLLGQLMEKEKEYVTRIRLGFRSTTDDGEGHKEEVLVATIPTEDDIRTALGQFVGIISQRPPAFSAIKLQGRPAYRLARKNRSLELAARQVEVKAIQMLAYEWPLVDVRMVTGPGVYVRAIARDLGEALGTGAYVEELERTRVGSYTADQAMRMSDLNRHRPSAQTS
jgi:tRNA pseudouridine55 synthase